MTRTTIDSSVTEALQTIAINGAFDASPLKQTTVDQVNDDINRLCKYCQEARRTTPVVAHDEKSSQG